MMKLRKIFSFVAFFIFSLINDGVLAEDCEKFPIELNMNLEQCCSFPNVSDPAAEKKIEEMTKNIMPNGKDHFLMACKIAQTVFTEMKLVKDNTVDKDAYIKMVDTKVPKDVEYWKQPLKDALVECQKSLMTEMPKITELFSKSPFNIKKEDCDAQYLVMFMCLHLDSFANCPEKAWKVNEKDPNHKACTSVKSWFGKCGKDLNALTKIVSKDTGST